MEVQGAVEAVFFVLPEGEKKRRTPGGYFVLHNTTLPHGSPPTTTTLIGAVSTEKRARYHRNALEKAARLHWTTQIDPYKGCLSSWMNRNEGAEQWGGAIRFGPWIFSFSGLPELADEAAMLLAALRLGVITDGYASEIAKQSGSIDILSAAQAL